jgi:choline dehydrogenase-like flavoprotein
LKVFKSNFDWDFASEPYPEIQNREVYICRGKVLGTSSRDRAFHGELRVLILVNVHSVLNMIATSSGGSSCANVLLYHRGDKHDYDDWVKATHSKEWSADEILPYFKKHEKFYKGDSPFAHIQFPNNHPHPSQQRSSLTESYI